MYFFLWSAVLLNNNVHERGQKVKKKRTLSKGKALQNNKENTSVAGKKKVFNQSSLKKLAKKCSFSEQNKLNCFRIRL